MTRPALATFALLASVLAAAPLRAQIGPAPSGRCALDLSFDRAGTTIKLPSGQRNYFVGGNVVARCPAQRLVLKSDSLEYYGDEAGWSFEARGLPYKPSPVK